MRISIRARLILAALAFAAVAVFTIAAVQRPGAEHVANVRTLLEGDGSQYLGAPIRIDDLSYAAGETTGTLHGIRVGNPAGFHVHGNRSLTVDRIEVEIDRVRSNAQIVVLERVHLDGIDVTAVVRTAEDSNVHGLLRGLHQTRLRAPFVRPAERPRFLIEQLAMTNITIDAVGELSREHVQAVFPDLHLQELDGTPLELEDMLETIIAPLAAGVRATAMQYGL
jgi:hypothetical protein